MQTDRSLGRLKNRVFLRILLPVIGIAVNVMLTFFISRLNVNLFFDSIGTIVVAAVAGLFPGILTAVLTAAACAFINPDAAYFSFVTAAIAIFTVWFIREFSLKKIKNIICYIAMISVFAGTVGAFINWGLLDGATIAKNSAAVRAITRVTWGNRFLAFWVYLIFVNLIDKTIATLIACGILAVIPKKVLADIERGNWKQASLSSEEIADLRRWTSNTRHPMRVRTGLTIVMTTLLLVIVTGWIGISLYYSGEKRERTESAFNVLRLSDQVIDHGKLWDYVKKGDTADGYYETRDFLNKLEQNSNHVDQLHFIRFEKDYWSPVFVLDHDEDELAGHRYEYDAPFVEYLPTLLAGGNMSPIEHGNINNWTRSIYYPYKDASGEVVFYGIADVSITTMGLYMKDFAIRASCILLGFFVLVMAHNLWVTNVTMVYPIRSMAKRVDEFSNQSFEQEQLDDNVRDIRALKIETQDEVELLYNSICNMTLELSEQMRSLRKLSEMTARMQDGLIITMADMVENRDSDTGAHIQKTASYVRIIVEGLRKKGYYAEKVDDKFISDVVRSAPLHDIGKINIPDDVLKKPGKLTDEEYEIIKTHTTAGKNIMDKAISTVEGESYLMEARNMAAYHHERWDGKGYPEGLHGEVIPLSARIMSVADVFDALTSPRVYKPAFSMEKALEILRDGAGSQFDPKCVEVFFDNLPEVEAVLNKYKEKM
jgi:response regulator RpfG family c-di-GMP phosphodiesterase